MIARCTGANSSLTVLSWGVANASLEVMMIVVVRIDVSAHMVHWMCTGTEHRASSTCHTGSVHPSGLQKWHAFWIKVNKQARYIAV
jgi:hypothetical protein